jgi:hypothetical protein
MYQTLRIHDQMILAQYPSSAAIYTLDPLEQGLKKYYFLCVAETISRTSQSEPEAPPHSLQSLLFY